MYSVHKENKNRAETSRDKERRDKVDVDRVSGRARMYVEKTGLAVGCSQARTQFPIFHAVHRSTNSVDTRRREQGEWLQQNDRTFWAEELLPPGPNQNCICALLLPRKKQSLIDRWPAAYLARDRTRGKYIRIVRSREYIQDNYSKERNRILDFESCISKFTPSFGCLSVYIPIILSRPCRLTGVAGFPSDLILFFPPSCPPGTSSIADGKLYEFTANAYSRLSNCQLSNRPDWRNTCKACFRHRPWP